MKKQVATYPATAKQLTAARQAQAIFDST